MSPFTGCRTAEELCAQLAALNRLHHLVAAALAPPPEAR